MRIMVFMKPSVARRFQSIRCALFLALAAAHAPAAYPPPVPKLNVQKSLERISPLPVLPKIEMLCPVVGLVVAIGITHLLQRRRNAQVQAWTRIDR